MAKKNDVRKEITEQLRTVAPTVASYLIYRMPWLISLRFVGHIGGERELAAAAFANSLCNILGMSLAVGLNSAVMTLASQARGDLQTRGGGRRRRLKKKNQAVMEIEMASLLNEGVEEEEASLTSVSTNSDEEDERYEALGPTALTKLDDENKPLLLLPLVYLYRGFFVQLLFVVPVACWWMHGIKPLLLHLGQADELSQMTEQYLRLLAPGLICYAINWTLVTWLQAIQMAHVPPAVATVGLALHIPISYFCVYSMEWGYLGCAVATSIFQFLQPIQLIVYIFHTKSGNSRTLKSMGAIAVGITSMSFWREAKAAVCSLPGILQYLGLAVPGLVAISEWWASEILIVLAGRLKPTPEVAVGAMTMFQSLNSLCYIFPVSFSIAGAMRVGNLLGAKNISGAAFASKVTLLCSGTTSGLIGIALLLMPHSFFPSLFAPTAHDLIQETSRLIPLLSVYVFGDSLASAFNGVIKGCGRQAVAVPVVLVSYWVIGIPLAYYVAFIRHDGILNCDDGDGPLFCGVRGLVFGSTIGTWLHVVLLGIVVVGGTNWELEAGKAGERVRGDGASNY